MNTTNAVDELLDHIADVTKGLNVQEQIMALCTISEHCKVYAETMLAHEYHSAIYGRRQASEW